MFFTRFLGVSIRTLGTLVVTFGLLSANVCAGSAEAREVGVAGGTSYTARHGQELPTVTVEAEDKTANPDFINPPFTRGIEDIIGAKLFATGKFLLLARGGKRADFRLQANITEFKPDASWFEGHPIRIIKDIFGGRFGRSIPDPITGTEFASKTANIGMVFSLVEVRTAITVAMQPERNTIRNVGVVTAFGGGNEWGEKGSIDEGLSQMIDRALIALIDQYDKAQVAKAS